MYIQKRTYRSVHIEAYIQKHTYISIHTEVYIKKHTYRSVHTEAYTNNCTYRSVHIEAYIQKRTYKSFHCTLFLTSQCAQIYPCWLSLVRVAAILVSNTIFVLEKKAGLVVFTWDRFGVLSCISTIIGLNKFLLVLFLYKKESRLCLKLLYYLPVYCLKVLHRDGTKWGRFHPYNLWSPRIVWSGIVTNNTYTINIVSLLPSKFIETLIITNIGCVLKYFPPSVLRLSESAHFTDLR